MVRRAEVVAVGLHVAGDDALQSRAEPRSRRRRGSLGFRLRRDVGERLPGELRSVPYRKHKCLAHHLRALKGAEEALAERGAQSLDLTLWKVQLKDVLDAWRRRDELSAEDYAAKVAQLRRGLDNLLARSPPEPEAVKFRNRMAKRRAHLTGCRDDPAVEPTNNRAERALRPAVIARKLSCGNKTPAGRETWQIFASPAETCAQRGRDFLDYLAPRLQPSPLVR